MAKFFVRLLLLPPMPLDFRDLCLREDILSRALIIISSTPPSIMAATLIDSFSVLERDRFGIVKPVDAKSPSTSFCCRNDGSLNDDFVDVLGRLLSTLEWLLSDTLSAYLI